MNIQVYPSFDAPSFESIEILITVGSAHVCLLIIYRPPPSTRNGCTKAQFYNEFDRFLYGNATSAGRLIIVGD